ncbi:MAG: hypothetical protein HXY34_03915 [Candidatus Thorarchaeota archaeon]|nr:hypothetical protein [Candidatus Thorarchaeota archaeon]
MIFRCRNCGDCTTDVDVVLDGACKCGCTRFQLIPEPTPLVVEELPTKEAIRRDLHLWLDLNIDSLSVEDLTSLRVSFESGKCTQDTLGS